MDAAAEDNAAAKEVRAELKAAQKEIEGLKAEEEVVELMNSMKHEMTDEEEELAA